MQNEVIKRLDPAAVMPDELIKGEGGTVAIFGFEDCEKEAIRIAEEIDDWVNVERLPHAEVAILVSKQPDLYAARLMAELHRRGIPFRNEQDLQDLACEPVARLIIDYLLVLYFPRAPEVYMRLMAILTESAIDDDEQAASRMDWNRQLNESRKSASTSDITLDTMWSAAASFLEAFGISNG